MRDTADAGRPCVENNRGSGGRGQRAGEEGREGGDADSTGADLLRPGHLQKAYAARPAEAPERCGGPALDTAALCLSIKVSAGDTGCDARARQYMQLPGHAAAAHIRQYAEGDETPDNKKRNNRPHSQCARPGAGHMHPHDAHYGLPR